MLNKNPHLLNPKLAKILSKNEALVLSQVDYRLNYYNNVKKGCKWVYDSVRAWVEDHFQYMSESTLKRTFKKLRDKGLLIVDNFNSHKYDKTLWYTIDYDKLNELLEEPKEELVTEQQPEELDQEEETVMDENPFGIAEHKKNPSTDESPFSFIYDDYDYYINGNWLDNLATKRWDLPPNLPPNL